MFLSSLTLDLAIKIRYFNVSDVKTHLHSRNRKMKNIKKTCAVTDLQCSTEGVVIGNKSYHPQKVMEQACYHL